MLGTHAFNILQNIFCLIRFLLGCQTQNQIEIGLPNNGGNKRKPSILASCCSICVYIYTFVYSGILSGNLSGIYSDILPDILSGILSGIYSDILSGIFSGRHSGIPSGSYSDILSGILTGILSHILSGMNSGRGPFHSLLSSIWRSGLGPVNTPRYNHRVQECPQHPDGQG